MPAVLHLLPHPGGGAETYIDQLEGMAGFTHRRIPLSAGPTALAAATSVPPRMASVIAAARRADVVQAHGDAAALLSLPVLAARPSAFTTHGLHLLRRRPRAGGAVVRAVLRAADITLCTSATERDELAALDPGRADRLVLARNGVAPAGPPDPVLRAAVRAELGLADGDVAVLFLGELAERKAPLDAVAAVEAARRDGAPLVLLLAGDGPLRGEIDGAASAGVRPLGFRTDPERLLSAADVFVLPSSREGLAFAVLEAMRAGLAMVVADGVGNPEAVGDAGVVVPAGDRDALARALLRLGHDGDERTRLAAAAQDRVAATFSLDRMLADVAAGYDRILREPGRAGGAWPA